MTVTLQYKQPTEEQIIVMQNFRDKMETLYKEIEQMIPSSRGKSLSLTKLEESAMWLNKSISLND